MGVRSYFPSSIAFVVLLCVDDRRLRVEVILDLQDRLLFVPIGILPHIRNRLPIFLEKLSAIAANILALQKWNGQDTATEYQPIFLLKGYQTTSNHVRFNVILGEPHGIQVGELDQRSEVQLDDE